MKVIITITIILLVMAQSLFAWEDQISDVEVIYLSDRVINITPKAGYPSFKAVNTSEGIVVINTGYSLELSKKYRRIIEQEFGRNDFRYVIRTSSRVLDQGGSDAFPEAIHISHSSVKEKMLSYQDRLDEVIDREIRVFSSKASRSRSILAEDPPGPDANQEQYNWMMFCQNITDYLESHTYTQKYPDHVFEHRFTIELGDCPIELIDFGAGRHGNNIIINMPSEGFMIAPAFSNLHLAPLPSYDADSNTVHHWIETLDNLLKKKETIKQVYCGFSNSQGVDDLIRSRKYMKELWDKISSATHNNLDFETAKQKLSIDEEFAYVKEWPIYVNEGRDWVEGDHARHFGAYWYWQHISAAKIIEETLAESGLEAAEVKFSELRDDNTNLYYIHENLFNDLGYRLMDENRLPEAIAVFRMNVDTHSESGNVYDSYGEALLKDGQTELAIEMYHKSLELDPDNNNARQILEEQGAL